MLEKTPGGQPINRVEVHLFEAASGQWKYDVLLDYTDITKQMLLPLYTPYLNPGTAAWMALEKATEANVSGVSLINNKSGYWILVVVDPPNGFPVLAR